MRYRVLATAVADRRRMLVVDDEGHHHLVVLTGQRVERQMLTPTEARRLEYDRAWVPARDHTPRTEYGLGAALTYR